AERLQGELDAANAVIEEGTGTIAELEGDLKKSKSTNESYTKKMDKANAAAKILEVWFDDSSNSITLLTTELMVAAIGDSGLEKKWTAYKESPSQDTFSAFLQAVVAIIEKNSSY
ncbi:MAG: hypothetical protein OEZ02_11735, partial [Anaerolineae bacterium]|nr:hypothetical protein [Anaerolineae bacterium]